MKTKLFTLFLALAASVGTMLAYDAQIGDLYYNLNAEDLTAEVTYKSYSSSYSSYNINWDISKADIPISVIFDGQTYSVTSIGDRAFCSCRGLTSVTIPNSVTSIGEGAFDGCPSLTSVTIPNSVTSVGDWAFDGDSGLTSPIYNAHVFVYMPTTYSGAYAIPDGIESIAGNAFYHCSGLTSITIGNSVKSIGNRAFCRCRGLTSVTIPKSVNSIGDDAFYGCSGLTSVTIPNSITSIGNGAFYDCSNLTSIVWNAKNCIDFSLNNRPFGDQITSFAFGEEVEQIPAYLCCGMSTLTSVTIGNSVTIIGSDAFSGCSGLTSVTIPNSVISIGQWAFSGCSNLTSVTIPNNVTSIGSCAFYGCRGLTSATIGNNVTSIGESAFYQCSSLTKVNISDVAAWCNISFHNYDANPLYYAKHLFLNDEEIIDLVIPNSVSSIGNYAFLGCSSLTSITIGNSVTSIGEKVFDSCSSMTSAIIGNSVTSVGKYAFSNCSSLNVVTIGNSVTRIGDLAFNGCSSLTSIVWNAKNCADFTSTNTPFYYYRSSYTFTIRPQIKSFTFGEEVEHIPAYLCSGLYNVHSITIPNSVTSIGDFAFSECSGLTSLSIPNNVTSIGGSVFKNCRNLTTIFWNATNCNDFSSAPFTSAVKLFLFGNKVEYIPAYLCSGLYNLTSITIPNSVTNIGNNAFYGCSGLISVTIPDNVTSIGSSAFNICSSLTSVTIPNSVTSIGRNAFSGCSSLTSVTIPNGVTSIGDYPFSGCSSMTSVIWNATNCNDFSSAPFTSAVTSFTLGDEVEHIPGYLCYNMTSLPSISIPHSVTSVGEYAFYGCKYPIYVECGDLERMKQLLSDYANYVQYESAPIYYLSTKATNGNIYTTKTKFTVCEEPFVTCTATANRGYQFVKWADGYTENPRTIELTQDTIMEALFEIATSGKCGRDNALVWKYDINTKALTITGEGELDANYTYGTFIESVTIGNGVTIIGSEAFYNCSKLTSITIPNSVTSIGSYAFYGCSSLVTATIGNGVTTINKQAFYNCSNLETVSLGGSIETIGSKAFYNCTRIIDIYCYAERVPEASSDAFDGVSRKAYLWVPANRVRNYKTHELWGQFDVQAMEADGVNTSTVNIVPTDNTAKIIWPAVENADTYEITIYDQNGNIVCQLVFDSEGLLQSIAFGAPGRDNATEATQATGFRFEVSSLTPGTTYNYTIVAKDATETVIDTKEGSFTTTGITAVEDIATNSVALQKVLRNGQLFIIRDGSRYTATGVKVE